MECLFLSDVLLAVSIYGCTRVVDVKFLYNVELLKPFKNYYMFNKLHMTATQSYIMFSYQQHFVVAANTL
jgi:hypothetical protein